MQYKQKPKILVVDDEPGIRSLLAWELKSRGMDVETARDGEEAARLAGSTKFDVVITDVTMPEADGFSLLSKLRKSQPETQVIMATGFGTVEVAVYAMQKGAFDFILKPFDLESLVGRIKGALRMVAYRCPCGAIRPGSILPMDERKAS